MNFIDTCKFCIKNTVEGCLKTVPSMVSIYLQANPFIAYFLPIAALIPMVKTAAWHELEEFVPNENLHLPRVFEAGDFPAAPGKIEVGVTRNKPDPAGRFDDIPIFNVGTFHSKYLPILSSICREVEQIAEFFITRGVRIEYKNLTQKVVIFSSSEDDVFVRQSNMSFLKDPLENLLGGCNQISQNAFSICQKIWDLRAVIDKASWNYLREISENTTILSEMGVIDSIYSMRPVNRTEYMEPLTNASQNCMYITVILSGEN